MTRRRWFAFACLALLVGPWLGWAAYAGVAWLRFGHDRVIGAPDALLDQYMPRYDIHERHQTRVAASPAATFRAVRQLDVQRSRVVRAIFRGRELMLGANAPPRPKDLPMIDELLKLGWGVLEEQPGKEIVFGAVTQPWESNVVFRGLPPSDYAVFDSAGYVKIVVTFAVDSIGPNESVFRTETRVLATDAESRAKFRRYWSVFSPGILLIRSRALALVRREAPTRAAP